MERRLAAILAADVVGYSRMIRADEEGTLVELRKLRENVIDPKIAEHHGRVVKLMGDGILVEFASVVDAVRAAVETQQAIAERNSDQPEDKRIEYRVGINMGDVVIDGDDIHGDGVNVASRLEALSEVGGVCISGNVYEEIRDRMDVAFEDFGDQRVKNIDRPVRVWSWTSSDANVTPSSGALEASLPLPDKPSIAVLAFENMSADPEQEYFADGIAEDIITALARMRELFVAARNSSFSYRGRSPDMRQVGRELGVRYVLEGSVRRAGLQVRITAQLIEAESGNHVWAERYDRPLDDIFEVQDEITANVAGAIATEIRSVEVERTAGRRAEELVSWDRAMRAYGHIHKLTDEDTAEARNICLDEIANSGGTAQLHAILAWSYAWDLTYGWGELAPADAAAEAARAGQVAIAMDPKNEIAHGVLAMVLWVSGHHEAAIREAEMATDLNPNLPIGHAILGGPLGYSGAEHYKRGRKHLQ